MHYNNEKKYNWFSKIHSDVKMLLAEQFQTLIWRLVDRILLCLAIGNIKILESKMVEDYNNV